jgi:hypothetical protein
MSDIPKPAARPQCASCRDSGQGAYCSACPRTAWEEYATSDDGLAEYDAVKQRARVQALEEVREAIYTRAAVMCSKCERKEPVFFEDRHYRHSKYGNYCSADELHKALALIERERKP